MCGIAGILRLDSNEPVPLGVLTAMCDTMTHRGPDNRGLYLDGPVGIGMRRLRIIDLDTGDQPIGNEDRSVWVILNGEIYNYLELRRELIARGHQFRTNSDTEVLVHLFEDVGPSMVERLNGMFGFAVWDGPRQQLVLGRDRVGKKPVHYAIHDGALLFSSEIKGLLAYPGFPRRVNHEALNHLLTYNYVPAPLTIFRDVHELPPGHVLVCRDGDVRLKPFWYPRVEPQERPEEEWWEDIRATLEDATRIRLRSDVPLGAFLSGGIDSSSVVATMSRLSDQPVRTFSIGFTDPRFDESPYARQVAALYRTEHHERVIEPGIFLDLLPRVIWHLDEPFGDVSFLPTLALSQLARESVTVVLTGDGGDELFAGYTKYRDFLRQHQVKLVGAGPEVVAQAYVDATAVFDRCLKDRLTAGLLDSSVESTDSTPMFSRWFEEVQTGEILDMLLYADLRSLLNDNNVVKPDRMAMAVSLEARAPYLDPRMIKLALSIPAGLKLKDGETKFVMKRALAGVLPHEILYRRKQMFTVPIGEWFRQGLKDYIREVLFDSRTIQRGYFNQKVIEELVEDHQAGRANYTRQLRLLLILELWHRMFIDSDPVTNPADEQYCYLI